MAARAAEDVSDGEISEGDSGASVADNSGGDRSSGGLGLPEGEPAKPKHAGGQSVETGEPVSGQMPQTTASLRNAKQAAFVADGKYQRSQMPELSNATNATNATTESLESVDFSSVAFAQPTGWGKLWRIERNGNYFIYRLRFVDSKDTPAEYRRITRKGGRLTPRIEAKLQERKGRGRHAESRTDADRFRGRAFDLAKRIRASH